jgi:hypothetical protein
MKTLSCTAGDDLIIETSHIFSRILPSLWEAVTGKRSKDLSLWAYLEFQEAGLFQSFSKEVPT